MRHAFFREGRFVDVHMMSILSGEWRARLRANEGASVRADPVA
jgi:hypothetical protein